MIEHRYRILGYGKAGWNDWTRTAIDPIDEAEARRRHDAGEPYGVVLTAGPGGVIDMPIVGIAFNEHGITVEFHRHHPGTADLTHFWTDRSPEGRLRIRQIDRRSGNRDSVRRDQLIHEYLKLDVDPAIRVRWAEGDAEVLDRRTVDRAPTDIDPPAFGSYETLLDEGLTERLWPGLPELGWLGGVIGGVSIGWADG